jgi:hypothetical protein
MASARSFALQDVASARSFAEWTWDTFLVAAEKCAKAGFPFGLPMGMTSDATFWVAALFSGFGVALVDAKGDCRLRAAVGIIRAQWMEILPNQRIIGGLGGQEHPPVPLCPHKKSPAMTGMGLRIQAA